VPGGSESGDKTLWLAMERPYFDYYLKGLGQPLPHVDIERIIALDDPLTVHFTAYGPLPIETISLYYSLSDAPWTKRRWVAVAVQASSDGRCQATLPAEAAAGADWFASASDSRPVTVSSDLQHIGK
jgi:hypothetical protein